MFFSFFFFFTGRAIRVQRFLFFQRQDHLCAQAETAHVRAGEADRHCPAFRLSDEEARRPAACWLATLEGLSTPRAQGIGRA